MLTLLVVLAFFALTIALPIFACAFYATTDAR